MLKSVQSAKHKIPSSVTLSHLALPHPGKLPVQAESQLGRLQSAYGNQRMQRFLAGVLQRKLAINRPGDVYEQEADRVADAVMRMPDPKSNPEHITRMQPATRVQRCSCGASTNGSGQCEQCRSKAMSLQRVSSGTTQETTVPPIVHDVLSSPGEPLDAATRNFMEPRFGHDFGQVRVHTDARAAESAQAVSALAYTVGHDIAFARSQYAPQTHAGQRLLAHELAHVSQQTEANSQPQSLIQRSPGIGFAVKRITREMGKLDDPSDSGTGQVSWPLSFAVTSPLEVKADVEVTGGPSDSCGDLEVGWLQTAHIHWLRLYYDGRRDGDGSSVIDFSVPLPIRDGDPDTPWASETAHEPVTNCGDVVTVERNDYPTIFDVEKVIDNAATGARNFLTGVSRGIHLVTTLVGKEPSGFTPLKFFYWNYLMDIHFRPNFASPNSTWPFQWKKNVANPGRIQSGKSGTVPMFTTVTPVFNQSLTRHLTQRT